MVPRRLPKEQLGKVSGEAGFARKSKNVEEEEDDDWQKENQMGMQWDEDEKLEETLERRRMEGKLFEGGKSCKKYTGGADVETRKDSGLKELMNLLRHIVLSFDGARRGSGLGVAAGILWLRDEYGTFEKVSYGGRVLMNASAMIAEREALRMGIEHLTVLFPTEVSSFDFLR